MREEERERESEMGGRRRRGGRGWDDKSHLETISQISKGAVSSDIPYSRRARNEADHNPARCSDFTRLVARHA
jgi:hypothetical protein